MRKLHIAISAKSIEDTVRDYTIRLGEQPCLIVPGEYALWRTATLNVSVRVDAACPPGTLRHLGWEDSEADAFSEDVDVNAIVWERFSAAHQADEIRSIWPAANYSPE